MINWIKRAALGLILSAPIGEYGGHRWALQRWACHALAAVAAADVMRSSLAANRATGAAEASEEYLQDLFEWAQEVGLYAAEYGADDLEAGLDDSEEGSSDFDYECDKYLHRFQTPERMQ